jgi:hypothetical protein
MLESFLVASVFQSLPTIYPISIQQESKKPKKKPNMERVKRLSLEKKRGAFVPRRSGAGLFAKTAGIFDGVMCCRSYAEQQLSVEAQEREREYREEISPGCGLDSVTKKHPDLLQRNKKVLVAPLVQGTTNRQYDFNNVTRQYDLVDESRRSPPQPKKRKGKAASRSRATAPYSPIGSSYSTATTVTANTYSTAEDSYSARSSAETQHELFRRESSSSSSAAAEPSDTRSLTDRTISVPSRSRSSRSKPIKLDSEQRRWSEGCVEFEQQQQQHCADHHYPYPSYYYDVPSEEQVIRKVQSESLAELPYLTMTEGYRC